jgi:hypothetical protein
MSQPFSRWYPALATGVVRKGYDPGEVHLEDRRGRYLAMVSENEIPLLDLLDGKHSVASLLGAFHQATGRLSPPELLALLNRLAKAGALAEAPPMPAGVGTAQRPISGQRVANLFDLQWMIRLHGAGRQRRSLPGWIAVVALLLACAPAVALGLCGWSMPPATPAALLLSLAAAAGALSWRGLCRWATATYLGGRPVSGIGLRLRFGIPFFDVHAATPAKLNSREQTTLSLVGVASLGAAALGAGLVAPESLFWGAFAALMLDLCPFARSDGALLVEHTFGIRWTRGRAASYLASTLLSRLGSAQRPGGEEGRLLATLVVWSGYVCIAAPFVIAPAAVWLLDAMVVSVFGTGGLAAAVPAVWVLFWATVAMLVGLGRYVAVLLGLAAQLTARFFESELLEQRSPDTGWLLQLEQALCTTDLELPEEPGKLLTAGQLVHVAPGQQYPEPDHDLPSFAIVLQGAAQLVRREVSGMTHVSGTANIGFIIGRGENPPRRWRFRAQAVEPCVIWELGDAHRAAPQVAALLARAGQVDSLENDPASWALGPDGVRQLAALARDQDAQGTLTEQQLERLCPNSWRDTP